MRLTILIDDMRSVAPDGTQPDLIVRNFKTALSLLDDGWLSDSDLYLDHDLGGEEHETGYVLISQIEEMWRVWDIILPKRIVCVSDNAPGRARIQQVIDKIYKDSK